MSEIAPRLKRPDLVISALVAMALNGEFLPPKDNEHRLHTLGGLAIGTVIRGREFDPDGAGLRVFGYNPKWADNAVSSTVVCEPVKTFDGNSVLFSGLVLSAPTINVPNFRLEVHGRYINVSSGDYFVDYELQEPGAELRGLRDELALKAQEFFEAVA